MLELSGGVVVPLENIVNATLKRFDWHDGDVGMLGKAVLQ